MTKSAALVAAALLGSVDMSDAMGRDLSGE